MTEAVSSAKVTLDQTVELIDEISTLPQIALRVMEVANDPDSCAADLKEVIEGDAALSARLLRCVNSSAYATRAEVTNLQQAIAYLGMKQIRNLAMTASVSELFKEDETIGLYRRSALWRHLVSVAICARLLAMRLKFPNFDDMFLAGLMHDIGLILEDQHVHNQFFTALRNVDSAKTLPQLEQDHIGFDHAQLGEKIGERWGFPDSVKAAIRYHHMSVSYRGEHVDLVRCVETANLICSLKGITSVGTQLVKMSPAVIQKLSLSKQDLIVLAEDLDHEIALNKSLFQV